MKSDKQKAVTLIELLAVIAVIGILTAILLPAVSKVRSKAHTAQSAANLRSLMTAANLFSSENNGYLPNTFNEEGRDWARQLLPYLDMPANSFNQLQGKRPPGVFACPASDYTLPTNGSWPSDYGKNAVFAWRSGNPAYPPMPQSRILEPAKILFFADSLAGARDVSPFPEGHNMGFRHNDRAQVVYLDGHIGSFAPDEVPGASSWRTAPWYPEY